MNGLYITEVEFKCMKVKDQLYLLFKNTEDTKDYMEKSKFHRKVQYLIMTALMAGMVYLFQLHLI